MKGIFTRLKKKRFVFKHCRHAICCFGTQKFWPAGWLTQWAGFKNLFFLWRTHVLKIYIPGEQIGICKETARVQTLEQLHKGSGLKDRTSDKKKKKIQLTGEHKTPCGYCPRTKGRSQQVRGATRAESGEQGLQGSGRIQAGQKLSTKQAQESSPCVHLLQQCNAWVLITGFGLHYMCL